MAWEGVSEGLLWGPRWSVSPSQGSGEISVCLGTGLWEELGPCRSSVCGAPLGSVSVQPLCVCEHGSVQVLMPLAGGRVSSHLMCVNDWVAV